MNDKRQSTDSNTEMCHMLELFDRDFKAAMRQTLQKSMTNSLETNFKKIEKSQQRRKSYKKEPNRNYK